MPVKKETSQDTANTDEEFVDEPTGQSIPRLTGYDPTEVEKPTISGTASSRQPTTSVSSTEITQMDYIGDFENTVYRDGIITDLLDVASEVFDRLKEQQLCQLRPKSDLLEQLKMVFKDMELHNLKSTDQKEIKTMILGMNMVGTVESAGKDLSEHHDDIYK